MFAPVRRTITSIFRRLFRKLALNTLTHRPARRSRRTARLWMEALEDRVTPTATPQVLLSFPQPTPFIGTNASFTATFNNAGTTVGYEPYIDLFLPTTGEHAPNASANYGVSFLSATYLGQAVKATTYTLPAAGGIPHPYAVDSSGNPLVITTPAGFEAGDELVVLQLPFGSFTSGEPALSIQINVAVGKWATVNTPQPIQADSGFALGNDPLNDPATDPSIVGATNAGSITPSLFTINTTYNGPENETATGPNFPESYTVNVSVAPNQTLTNLDITDSLPNNLAYLGVTSGSPGYSILSQPPVGVPQNTPNPLTVQFASVTGTGGNDAHFTFQFYIPQNDANNNAVLNPNTGAFVPSPSSVQGQANWTPLAPGSTSTTVTSPVEVVPPLTDKSIAVQKSVSVLDTAGNPGYTTPNDTLLYTVHFEVSDFFAVQNAILNDTISDGQSLDPTYTPTLTFSQAGVNVVSNAPFAAADVNYDSTPNAADGSTSLTLNISGELAALGDDSQLIGGYVLSPTGGATEGTITYRTIINTSYNVENLNGDKTIVQGDTVGNHVWVSGDVLNNSNLSMTTGSTIKDDSGTQTVISQGSLQKSIYAINGVTGTYTNPSVAPGDTVTYRLTLQLATSNFDKLTLADYLPLPVYDATTVTSWSYGPADTFHTLAADAPVPSFSTNGTANSVTFTYGDTPSDIPNHSSTIDLLFNIQVGGEPFADGLLLTNMAQGEHSDTGDVVTYLQQSLQQSVLTEPNLTIKKGVIASSDAGASYSQAKGPTTFTAPGSSGPRFTSDIDSADLATPIDANISGIQASDTVTFADVVQNIGSGLHGAFDVTIKDALPPGFANATNIEVTDGNGNPLAFTGNLFGAGIVLTDPNTGTPGVGALTPYSATSGTNLVIITYDAVATQAVEPNQLLDSSASVTLYSSVENGPNFVPNGISDDASARVANIQVNKAVINSSESFTTGVNLTIGEEAQYQVVITAPQGTATNATLVDQPTAGLAFVSLDSLSASSALSTSVAGGFSTVLTNAQASLASGKATFNFGTLTNSDTNDATAETITLTYTVVALNNGSNIRGNTDKNNAKFQWDDGSVSKSATVDIVEPKLTVAVTPSVTSGQAGTPVTYTLVVTNVNDGLGTDGFNAALQNVIPNGVDYVAGSLQFTGGTAPDAGSLQIAGQDISANWTRLNLGQSATITFKGVLDTSVSPTQPLVDTANVTWTSLPSPVAQESPYNPLSVERTGNTSDPGGANNTYDANGSDTITVFNVGPVKSVVATSEAFTGVVSGVQTVTIGEVVRYRLQVQLPNSTMNGFQLVDPLPAGLGFVDPANVASLNADLVLIADQPMTLPADLVANYSSTGNNATTPTVALDPADININGQTVTFTLGNIVNNDTDSTPAYATLDFDVLVLNSNANQSSDTITNQFDVFVNGAQLASNKVNVQIVEPALTDTLTVNPGGADAGDTMTYTATFTNNGTSPAFDSNLLDNLPNTVTLVGSATTTLSGGAAGVHDNSSGNQINLGVDTIPVGGSVTVVFEATVNSTGPNIPNPGAVIPDTDTVTTTTLPGTGTQPNPTGENTPGASGAANGERNGSGGVNTLSATANASFSIYSNSVGGTVYYDNNNNGAIDAGENGVGGVSVTLTGTNQLNQSISMTTTTLANGSYQFTGLRPGTYIVTKTPVAGLFDGKDTVGTPFGGGNGTPDVLSNVVIPHGSNPAGTGYNFGELIPSTFGGEVYLDNNDNGAINAGENGVGSATVTLTGKNDLGNPVSLSVVTTATGLYQFPNLRPSDANGYTITETPPPNLFNGKDTPGSAAVHVAGTNQFNTVLPPNTNDPGNNFGELVPSVLSGYVYRDTNLNGTFDSGDSGIPGVTITLSGTDDLGHAVNTTVTTNASGFYSFGQLRPGNYTITETRPALYGNGSTNVGTQGGVANGNVITITNLLANVNGVSNNFGEINLPPAITPIGNDTINSCAGQILSQQVTFADAVTDGPWTALVNYGDGSPLQTINLGSAQSFILQHSYSMDQSYQVTVTVQDSYHQSATTSFLVLDDMSLPVAYNQLFTVNNGSAQRSMIDSLTVTFNQLVTFNTGAFTLVNQSGASIGLRTITQNIGNQTVVLIQFTGATIINGSLADGNYTFTINNSLVNLLSGGTYGSGSQSFQFFRMFGDVNGDGKVNATDLAAFNAAMRSKMGDANYVWYLDYDGNCQIDATDYRYFLMNYRP